MKYDDLPIGEYGERYVRWNFAPYHEVRQDRIEEIVFTKKWQELMLPQTITDEQKTEGTCIDVPVWFIDNEKAGFPILDVIRNTSYPSEHDTRIASNMIRWLGTNEGYVYRRMARDYIEGGIEPENAFIAAWSTMNVRHPALGYRRIPRDDLGRNFNDSARIVSTDDYETLDQVAHWLGSDDGQKFITSCERNIDIKIKRERESASRRRRGLDPVQS